MILNYVWICRLNVCIYVSNVWKVKISHWYSGAYNSGTRLPRQLDFVLWAPNTCGSSVWHTFHFWRLKFSIGWKIFRKFRYTCSGGYHENCSLKCDAIGLVDLSQHFCGMLWPQQIRRASGQWSWQVPLKPAFVSTDYTVSISKQRQSSARISFIHCNFYLFSISGKAGLCTKYVPHQCTHFNVTPSNVVECSVFSFSICTRQKVTFT